MNHSKKYLAVRSTVRAIFWTTAAVAALALVLAAIQLVIIAAWSLQF